MNSFQASEAHRCGSGRGVVVPFGGIAQCLLKFTLLPSLEPQPPSPFLLSRSMTTLAYMITIRELTHSERYPSCPATCAINYVPCVDVVSAASPQHLKERPAKRARVAPTKAGNSVRVGLSKRGRGCLSALPTLPLDVLFEVCSLRCLVIEATSEGHILRFSVIFIPRSCFGSVA